MAGRRRRYLFRRRRHSAPQTAKRPITMQSKVAYAVCLLSFLIYIIGVNVAVVTEGEIIKLFAGVGFCFLLLGIYLISRTLRRIKNDDEPKPARYLAVAASVLSIIPWGYLYVLGMMHE